MAFNMGFYWHVSRVCIKFIDPHLNLWMKFPAYHQGGTLFISGCLLHFGHIYTTLSICKRLLNQNHILWIRNINQQMLFLALNKNDLLYINSVGHALERTCGSSVGSLISDFRFSLQAVWRVTGYNSHCKTANVSKQIPDLLQSR